MATATGSITIVDIGDLGELSVTPTSNQPSMVIYDPNGNNGSGSYSPNWSTSNLVLTPVIYYGGTTLVDATHLSQVSGLTVQWYQQGSSTEISSDYQLTISTNVLANIDYVTYVVKVTYNEPNSGVQLKAEGQISFSKVTNASQIRSIDITGDSAFLTTYNSDNTPTTIPSSITLTANSQYYSGTIYWYYQSGSSWIAAGTGATKSVSSTDSSFIDGKTAIYRATSAATASEIGTDGEVFDVHTIIKVSDGINGSNGTTTKSVVLSNEDEMVPFPSASAAPSEGIYTDCNTTISVFDGATDITRDISKCRIFMISRTSEQVANANVYSNTNKNGYLPVSGSTTGLVLEGTNVIGNWTPNTLTCAITSLTADTGRMVFYVYFNNDDTWELITNKKFSLVKVYPGQDGQPGEAGAPATVYRLNLSSVTATHGADEDAQSTYSPSSITLSAQKIVGSNISDFTAAQYLYSIDGGTEQRIASNTHTFTFGTGSGQILPNSTISIKLVEGSSSSPILDSQTITIITDGADGAQGEDGESALSLILGNYSDQIPCENTGEVIGDVTKTINFKGFLGTEEIQYCKAYVDSGTITNSLITNATGSSNAKLSPITVTYKDGTTLAGVDQGTLSIIVTAYTDNTYSTELGNQTFTYSWVKNKQASATYIYYAQENSSTNTDWHKTPLDTDNYIGIYSGPLVSSGQPSNPNSSWLSSSDWSASKYVGPKGEDGAQGAHGINTATVYMYKRATTQPDDKPIGNLTYTFETGALTPSASFNGWGTSIPTTGDGPCWAISAPAVGADDTDTIEISEWSTPIKLEGEDGEDANAYTLEVDHDEVFKFMEGTSLSLGVGTVTFSCYKKENDSRSLVNLDTINTKLELIYSSEYGTLWDNGFSNLWPLVSSWANSLGTSFYTIEGGIITLLLTQLTTAGVDEGSSDTGSESIVDSFTRFQQLLKEYECIFTLRYFLDPLNENSEQVLTYFKLKFGTTNEMAKFNITATNINAAVGSSRMIFDSDGLIISGVGGGHFEIQDENGQSLLQYPTSVYIETTDEEPIENKNYYIKNDEGNYIVVSVEQGFDPTKTYYEYIIEDSLNVIGNGNFTGNIYANGGYFQGELRAATGSFEGNITANTGSIGGLEISDNGIRSSNNNFVLTNEGDVTANSITLGEFAKIDKYIQLGAIGEETEAYLYNPQWALENEALPYFFKVNNNVYLTSKGELNLNRIVLDGITSTIKGTRQDTDPNFGWPDFYINPDKAYFPNVEVSGKISTAIFEVGHTQAVGGSMLFKPSYKITSTTTEDENTILTLEEDPSLYLSNEYEITSDTSFKENKTYYELIKNEDEESYYIITEDESMVEGKIYYTLLPKYVSIINNDGQEVAQALVKSFQGHSVIIEGNYDYNSDRLVSLIVLGVEDNLIIGINSTDVSSMYMRPRGLTISEFKPGEILPVPKVYLGDLARAGFNITGLDTSAGSYGLYSNNVILNGSLTTQVITENEATYAGVNTLSQASATIFGDYLLQKDESKIVFWAGSEGVESSQIQHAPFQVTEKGSIYAAAGLFEGVIISKSTIKGVDLYAARIHGAAKDTELVGDEKNEYGLSFFDADEGIIFKKGGDTDETASTLFTIGGSGFRTEANSWFISIDNNNVDFHGRDYTASNNIHADNTITGLQLISLYNGNDILIGGNGAAQKTRITYRVGGAIRSYIDLFDSNSALQFNNGNVATSQLAIFSNEADFTVNELHSTGNFQLGSSKGNGYMRYLKVSNGYDLYV